MNLSNRLKTTVKFQSETHRFVPSENPALNLRGAIRFNTPERLTSSANRVAFPMHFLKSGREGQRGHKGRNRGDRRSRQGINIHSQLHMLQEVPKLRELSRVENNNNKRNRCPLQRRCLSAYCALSHDACITLHASVVVQQVEENRWILPRNMSTLLPHI